jgi:hypothetical protein
MIFDYSLAALVAAGLLFYLIYPCCGLSDFSAERTCPGFGFVRHANMVAAGALMTTRILSVRK